MEPSAGTEHAPDSGGSLRDAASVLELTDGSSVRFLHACKASRHGRSHGTEHYFMRADTLEITFTVGLLVYPNCKTLLLAFPSPNLSFSFSQSVHMSMHLEQYKPNCENY